ncbi:MAG: hypothetical protein LBC88_05610, partial [Spirochaetaceae bacterium]|nr:hypothetical protein [Spirochaetaceae bacterium]
MASRHNRTPGARHFFSGICSETPVWRRQFGEVSEQRSGCLRRFAGPDKGFAQHRFQRKRNIAN